MRVLLLLVALLVNGVGYAATLTGTITNAYSAVDLPAVGTLDYARWPGYTNKAGLISNFTHAGVLKTYTNDRRIIGDRSGVKVWGVGASFEFNVQATTADRELKFYIGGWNSGGRVTASMPGATSYTTAFKNNGTYSRLVTLRFRADAPAQMKVRFVLESGAGTINMQAAALRGLWSKPPPTTTTGSAALTWNAPTRNIDGTTLTDLAGFKVYWGKTQGQYTSSTRINDVATRGYTVSGLSAGTWYFTVTALTASGAESSFSNSASKTIQ